MYNLIRKIKLHQIEPVLSKKELKIIEFIYSKLENLNKFKRTSSEIFAYMNKNGEFIFSYNLETHYTYVRYNDYMEVLRQKYKIKFEYIKEILKYIIENKFKIKIDVLMDVHIFSQIEIEKVYKQIKEIK